jgi:hypothetical protein
MGVAGSRLAATYEAPYRPEPVTGVQSRDWVSERTLAVIGFDNA